jgi:hypothetical protein
MIRRILRAWFRFSDRLFLSESMHYRIYNADQLKVK